MYERVGKPKILRSGLRLAVLYTSALALFLFCPRLINAQEDQPPPSSDQDASSAASSGDEATADSERDAVPEPGATSTLDMGQVNNYSGSSNSRVSALQWGHLAFVSYDAFYAYDSNFRFSPSHPQSRPRR